MSNRREFPSGLNPEMGPAEGLKFLISFLESGPDEHMLCSGALTIGEPLVDWWGTLIEDELCALLETRSDFRKMVSCCDFDTTVPLELRERLYSYVIAEDNHGGSADE